MNIIKKEYKKLKLGDRPLKRLFFLGGFVAVFLYFVQSINAQDTIVPQQDPTEKINFDFQEHFFKALTEKAINNYQNAIENLEECDRLKPNNKAVLFELSKNYLALKKLAEAIDFGEKALTLDTENHWILKHLVKTYKKNYNFKKAIYYQEKIVEKYPKEKQALVYLHLQNNDVNASKKVLNELANAKMLNFRLRKIKRSLEKRQTAKTTQITTNSDPKKLFEKKKAFKYLKPLLVYLDHKNDVDLLKYSEQGLSLFPAQPFVYLMNGVALNKQKLYKKALVSLQNGIDFVVDDAKTTKKFYNELLKSYQGLGDKKEIKKYKNKLKSL